MAEAPTSIPITHLRLRAWSILMDGMEEHIRGGMRYAVDHMIPRPLLSDAQIARIAAEVTQAVERRMDEVIDFDATDDALNRGAQVGQPEHRQDGDPAQ